MKPNISEEEFFIYIQQLRGTRFTFKKLIKKNMTISKCYQVCFYQNVKYKNKKSSTGCENFFSSNFSGEKLTIFFIFLGILQEA